MRYAERRKLPYAPEQLFDLVADIETYPQFLPWCIGARITGQQDNIVTADLVIGWKMIRETFTSKVTLNKPFEISVDYLHGPMKNMVNRWRFEPEQDGSCTVDFFVEFEFKSRALQLVMGAFFDEAAKRMVGAFEKRARVVLK
jgi:coenzyme Q-binding protein COQ10